jgi:hypothetical protein
VGEELPSRWDEHLAIGGKADRSGCAVEQRGVQGVFEVRDPSAEAARRDAESLGGPGEVEFLREHDKGLDLVEAKPAECVVELIRGG